MTEIFDERMRMIRLRRKKENPKFREELKVIPRWLVWTCLTLWIVALIVIAAVNLFGLTNEMNLPPELQGRLVLTILAMWGLATVVALVLSTLLFMLGYVYRDAKRRGMNAPLWTLLVLILSPGYMLIGLIIYLLVREPLPYPCPHCGTSVGPRFNFCPNCRENLHPACGYCKREVSEVDKFCPYCGNDLKRPGMPETEAVVTG